MNPRPYRAFLAGAASSLILLVGAWLIWVWLGTPALPSLPSVAWSPSGGFTLAGGSADPSGFWGPVRDLRAAVRAHLVPLGVLAVGLSLVVAAALARRRGRQGAIPGLLLVSLALASAGEMAILAGHFGGGAALYLAAGTLLIATLAGSREQPSEALEPVAWSRRREALALALVMLVACASRWVQIGDIPYGWEGDEVNWVSHVVQSQARPERERVYPLDRMPTSYLMQAPAHQLMGTGVRSARRGIALFSIVATLLFYFAVRAMVNVPVALLATFLMAISIVDIAASRVSHVEAHVKIWSLLAALCLAVGYRRGRGEAWLFLGAGVALAMGLMVYDSFVFTPVPFVVYMVYRLARDRVNWRRHLAHIGLLLLPMALVAPTVWTYLSGRRANQLAILTGATGVLLDSVDKVPQLLPALPGYVIKQAGITLHRLTFQAMPDVLIGRTGPMESAAFVPFLFLGLILALRYWRRGLLLFALLWLLVPALPTSLLIGQASARTFFPYWGAFQIMAAIAVWVLYRALSDVLGGRLRWLPAAAMGLFLALLGISNLYAYFNEVNDPPDRELRHELGDLVRRHIAPGELIFLPHEPLWGDFMGFERNAPWVETRDQIPLDQEDQFYRFVPYPDLLNQISIAKPQVSGLKVVYDKTIQPPGAREVILEAFKRCFPGRRIEVGRAFDVYIVTARDLAASDCYSDVEILPVQPAAEAKLAPDTPVRFEWRATKGGQTAYQLQLDRLNERVVWLEAESLALGGGWAPAAALAPGFSGTAYVEDVQVSDTISASLKAEVLADGLYDIWARTFRRRDDNSPAFLTIDGLRLEIAKPMTDTLKRWQWERVGQRPLTAGPLELRLSRQFDLSKDPWSVFVDAVALSADPDFDPNVETNWEAMTDQGTIASAERTVTLPEPLAPGRYRWRVKVADADRLVAPDGGVGLLSPESFFDVAP